MPILSKIGRKSPATRLRIAAIYIVLGLGAVAMLYPLGLMLAGSTKSMADLRENRLAPPFLYSDEALWQKHLEALFNESLDALNIAFGTDYTAFNRIPLPDADALPHGQWLGAWEEFLAEDNLPPQAVSLGYYWAPQAGAFPLQLRAFRRHLNTAYGNLETMNRQLVTDFDAWYNVFVQPPAYLFPYARLHATPMADEYDAFKMTVDPFFRVILSPEGYYKKLYLKPRYTRDIAVYNAAHGTAYASYDEILLPPQPPSGGHPLIEEDWRDFTTHSLSPLWKNPDGPLDTPDLRWREWLVQNKNIPPETAWTVPMPQLAFQAARFRNAIPELRREFLRRNYLTVLDYILFHGRGIFNTVVYCTLAVLLALLVNPLAAYALSRGHFRCTTQILFFLMLTMAFPHMVTQIPVFILLREFGLLNTFAALLLPGMASGYSIFLLKGFFDSLPRDLYESAQLDGAGEWTLFWQLTMRLSTPILSVIALQAFTLAYANFMYALLICQDPKMWTLMVWLYQLQQRSGPGVLQASLILAAIPTLLVFIACQRVLLRGIVVPVEK